MKKILFLLLLISVVSPAAAQRWTVWYGINYSGNTNDPQLFYQWRLANAGVDYTFPMSRWDFTGGVGFNTKGADARVNYAQIEGNVGYRFIDTPKGFRVSAFTGPCFGIRVADDQGDKVPIHIIRETTSDEQIDSAICPTLFGWHAGLSMKLRFIALKIGYERSLKSYWDPAFSEAIHMSNGKELLTTSIHHSLFIRLGFMF